MGFDVLLKRCIGFESLITAIDRTDERADIGMSGHMFGQSSFAFASKPTVLVIANESLFSEVSVLLVSFESELIPKLFITSIDRTNRRIIRLFMH